MDLQKFEDYQRKMRELAFIRRQEPHVSTDGIFSLINEFQETASTNNSDEAFFNGERFFFQGDYEQALKCYLEAKEIPGFQFFCYRVSSLISKERGQHEKALSFAEKAFQIDPEDPIVSELMDSFQQEGHSHQELEEIPSAIEAVHKTTLSLEAGNYHRDELFAHEFFPEHNKGHLLQAQQMHGGNHHAVQVADAVESCIHGLHQHCSPLESIEVKSALENSIQAFQKAQMNKMQAYLQRDDTSAAVLTDALYVLNGWLKGYAQNALMLTEESRKSTGGHFLRWNGKGIALNPGPNFLDYFHEQGLSIRDIDYVIVTRDHAEAFMDVKGIADLNYQLNKVSPERQIIHYYLHHRAYQELAGYLKPSFKQARNTIHKLEMFLDSPDVEKIELEEGIVLHYFLGSLHDQTHGQAQYSSQQHFGIRLELSNDLQKLHLGYLSGLTWSPLISHHLGYCDLLLAAFGNTSPKDFSMISYNEDSLGYYGVATLLQQINPKLLLLTEFGGREGDIRIDVVKRMRREQSTSSSQTSILLPADIGLRIDLRKLSVNCSLSTENIQAAEIKVAASNQSFGRLSYLSPRFCV